MGSRQSSMSKNENSVYKILEADENTTPAQIKQNYIRLLRKHHPDYGKEKDIEKTQQIIAAYTKLKEKNFQVLTMELFENINFRRYSLVYFQRLEGLAFFTEVNKIYRTIEKNESLYFENGKYPKFGDDATKIEAINRFYNFYKNFKTNVRFERTINNKNIFDKNYDKEERRIYNENIRNLTHSIYLCDYRIKKNVFESVITVVTKKEEKVKFKKKKDIGKYAFYCDACKKGFMSDKTMISHLKSEKHKTKATELGLEDRSIEEIMSEATIEKDTKESSSDSFVEEKVEIAKDEQDIDEKMTEHAQEDEIADDIKVDEINKVTNKIVNLKIKSAKSKGTKKKPVNHKDKENVQMLTCANCKTTFESRNKLFAHIKSQHLAKHDKSE